MTGPAAPTPSALATLHPLPHTAVRVHPDGWQERNAAATLPHCVDQLGVHGNLTNLRRVAGTPTASSPPDEVGLSAPSGEVAGGRGPGPVVLQIPIRIRPAVSDALYRPVGSDDGAEIAATRPVPSPTSCGLTGPAGPMRVWIPVIARET